MKIIEDAPTYKNIDLKTLQVDLYLSSKPAFYDALALDAVLSSAVVDMATRGRGLPDTLEPYFIPLPLEKMWTCPMTFAPLWNATQFFPLSDNAQQTAYWHKRGYRPEMVKRALSGKPHNANFGQGRHKEYRMPLPIQSCLKWRAYCVGDVEEVSGLLASLHSVGKKRSQGHGRVKEWQLMEIDAFSYFHEGRFIKAFPVAYPNKPELEAGISFSRYETGWTPPYWNATLFQECIL